MSATRVERVVTYTVLALFAVGAIYPVLSILFLGSIPNDLVTGFAWPTDPSLSSFRAAWTEGDFGTGLKSASSWRPRSSRSPPCSPSALAMPSARCVRGDRWLFGSSCSDHLPYEATVILPLPTSRTSAS